MVGGSGVISFDEALAIVVAQARPLAAETVAIEEAAGRVLAAPCIAQVDAPRADISAMDGYAITDAGLALSASFRVIGTAYPGAPFAGLLVPGDAVRIFTGAPIPDGVDRVVIQEEVSREGDHATLLNASPTRTHIRRRGSDFCAGDVLLPEGRLLDPRALVVAAGADLASLGVWRRPRVSVISTGDELAAPGSSRENALSIPESASFGAAALAQSWGGRIVGRRRRRDDIAEMTAGAREAMGEADLVIVTGGASVGDKDYAKRVFADIGAELLFAKVAMMPGKPVWFARRGAQFVLGLPGNPGSAMVTARLLLAPLVAGLAGRDPLVAARWRTAQLASALTATSDRETFVRARDDRDGVSIVANQDSGAQLALADADLLIRRTPHAPALNAGDEIEVLDF